MVCDRLPSVGSSWWGLGVWAHFYLMFKTTAGSDTVFNRCWRCGKLHLGLYFLPPKLSSAFILCFSSTYIYQKWSRSFQSYGSHLQVVLRFFSLFVPLWSVITRSLTLFGCYTSAHLKKKKKRQLRTCSMLVRLQLGLDIFYSGVSMKSPGPELALPPLKHLSGLESP